MIEQLIAVPSVSSVSPAWDQSNARVIEHLASWFEHRGFTVQTLPLPGDSTKLNMVATLGSGPDGLVLNTTGTVFFDLLHPTTKVHQIISTYTSGALAQQ